MGKKGTKRKTKWRALPLGEEAGGSGNEEDLHDEDRSTASAFIGGHPIDFRRPPFYYKVAERSYRQTRRFTYDRFRSKEPLVKLESKKFDEEEYTKITTPRQDVLFKKGYFGRKRESSVEETLAPSEGIDGEEPMMDQIIITNGFLDERGHYLVNGNSYEIYDPYSNTVTVVVGPPPYANGVTQPVLAAVSCQPVPLQPVDWYPPGADWPSQGSAWTPSYSRNTHPDSANSPDGVSDFPVSDAQIPNLYDQPAYVMPGYGYEESSLFNGVPLQTNPSTEAQNSDEENRLELKKARRKSTCSVETEEKEKQTELKEAAEEVTPELERENLIISHGKEDNGNLSSPSFQFCENQNHSIEQVTQAQTECTPVEEKQVTKQSHSTQTNLFEAHPEPRVKLSGKESHSTQTPPDEFFQSNSKTDLKAQEISNKNSKNTLLYSPAKTEGETKTTWKFLGNSYSNSVRKVREESPRKIFHQRINFSEERKLGVEKSDSGSGKVSYAKKAMSGLENLNSKIVNGTSGKISNGGFKNQALILNEAHQIPITNGTNKANNANRAPNYEYKRNGFVRTRYNSVKSAGNDKMSHNFGEKKQRVKPFENAKKCEDNEREFQSHSEKSSTVSELSSPTELSSGQNTPPEKLIVQKIEEEINKTFENRFKHSLSTTEKIGEGDEEEEGDDEGRKKKKESVEKSKGKKKKNKVKLIREKSKECGKGNKKNKKREEEEEEEEEEEVEVKEKFESDNSSEEVTFLTDIRPGRDLLFGTWEDLNVNGQNFISEMDSFLDRDREILKSLGLNDDRTTYSKLPLHSDLLMMLPTFGWSRSKLKIEDFFVPAPFHNDLFTKRNITNMKSTKPEDFFASVIDGPIMEKTEKKKESPKKMSKTEETLTSTKKTQKTGCKVNKNAPKKPSQEVVAEQEAVSEAKDLKLGIVEAVNTWLQEQSDSEKFITVGSFENLTMEKDVDQKNGASNPIHVLSPDASSARVVDFRENGGCIRVANVINDGFIRVNGEFHAEKKLRKIHRSSSWDAKLSEVNIKKHFKFLTDSASFCQDLISDVRNGLPTRIEYATEELCDPKQTVTKYYILAPNGRMRSESESENEVFDALEYKFLSKENQEVDGKSFNGNGNGNASITDSGVHSDMELSEDNATEQLKETTCKLQ